MKADHIPSRNDDAPDTDERVAAALESLRSDRAKVREADEWMWGCQEGEHYNEVESALADLHSIEPADLLASDLLTRLYQLAKLHGIAREERLIEMAQEEVERREQADREIAADLIEMDRSWECAA
jgi:hypothetical protein